ncbi:MAG: FkbM family methyltransferase [Parachlamydiaceae bacterium]|nr:FkbM family methyltransferase [Parachlamydiaceae bacterium]
MQNLIGKYVFNFLIVSIIIGMMSQCASSDKSVDGQTVLIAILAKDKAHYLPRYLNSIENLDYNKKLITIYINTNNNTDNTKEILEEWAKSNKNKYKDIIFDAHTVKDLPSTRPHEWTLTRFKTLGAIRYKSLIKTKECNCDYYFVIDVDNFVIPSTLKDLVDKQKPIIAPMLKAIPVPGNPYTTFFADVTDRGYFQYHPDFDLIQQRIKVGTFKVPLVHCTYLVDANYIDKLYYLDGDDDYEFVVFARSARKNNVDMYICNEKHYGTLIHVYQDQTLKEEIEEYKRINPNLFVDGFIDKTQQISSLFKDKAIQDSDLTVYQGNIDTILASTTDTGYMEKFQTEQYDILNIPTVGSFYIDRQSDIIKDVLRKGQEWEPNTKQIIEYSAVPNSIAVDIGAHIGTHSLTMSKCVGPEGKVFSFEPQRKIFREFVMNMKLNKIKNVTAIRCALGALPGTIEMEATVVGNEGGTGIGTGGDKAPMFTLDQFNLDNVSFIKIDVENTEEHVLTGAMGTIMRNRPIILLEILGNNNQPVPDREKRVSEIVQRLIKMNYNVEYFHLCDYLATPVEIRIKK